MEPILILAPFVVVPILTFIGFIASGIIKTSIALRRDRALLARREF